MVKKERENAKIEAIMSLKEEKQQLMELERTVMRDRNDSQNKRLSLDSKEKQIDYQREQVENEKIKLR
jgi:hypothetical protein